MGNWLAQIRVLALRLDRAFETLLVRGRGQRPFVTARCELSARTLALL